MECVLTPIKFGVRSVIFGPLVANYVPKIARNQGFRSFSEKLFARFTSYLGFLIVGGVSWPLLNLEFVTLFLALWWPNICPK